MNNIIEKIIQILFRLIGVGWGFGTVSSEVKCVKSIIKNGSVFIDCGGNIGNYSNEIIKSFNDPEIHIFEPSSKNVTILQKRFSNNNKIKINGVGLSNKTSESILFSNESGSGLASLTKRKLDHLEIDFNIEEEIRLIQFKDYWNEEINSEFIDLFKIDVEGHELDVLKGIGEKISNIKLIQFEFGGCNIDTRTFFQDFWYFFNKNNFKIFRISPFGLIELSKYKEIYESFTTTNFLCLNKDF
jgi:FkbM family methyltransferase